MYTKAESVAMAVVYTAAFIVMILDLFVWRSM